MYCVVRFTEEVGRMCLKVKSVWLLVVFYCFGSTQVSAGEIKEAIFAGGCFWCMEKPFDQLSGVISTTSGYIGGTRKNPTYSQVSSGRTGHTEAVKIEYDPALISYDSLLSVFWRNIDPLDARGQFCDKGSQYRSGIFYIDARQKEKAEASLVRLQKEKFTDRKIATEITQASEFYAAEDYHQNYYQRNPVRYRFYRFNCGRDKRLKALWGDKQS